MKKRIVYIISNIDRAVGFEEIYKHLHNSFDLTFILLNEGNSYFENHCLKNNIPCNRIKYTGKKDMVSAIYHTFVLLRKIRPHIVHTHLLDGSLIGLIAAKLAYVPKRIHTRHHSDFHHTYFPHAVKYDKFINRISHKIIAVSPGVRDILIKRENVAEEKIITIFHGFKINEFDEIALSRIDILKEKYNPANKYPVIGVISRYTEWKGIQYIIPAFKELLKECPDALLILANAQGTYGNEINKLLNELPESSFIQITFEHDLHALYKLFTVFVHVPITEEAEAFGQVYIEALLSKVPCVFTRSGVANEFPGDNEICLFIKPKNSNDIYQSISEILQSKDRSLIKDRGYDYASKNFNIEHQMAQFEKLYNTL